MCVTFKRWKFLTFVVTPQDVDPDEDVEDSGAECVICMSDMRDTLILPCRHLCLCSACAESLRYQASMCPICRVKFRALLQVRAMRRKLPPVTGQQPVRLLVCVCGCMCVCRVGH